MKKYFSLVFIALVKISAAQIYLSDCNVPEALATGYEWDIKNLALYRIYEVHSPDTAQIAIPAAWQDTIMEGMAAILNLFDQLPESDSVFNLYCVHDRASWMYSVTESIMVTVDTSYAWTDAWQELNAITGNPDIDSLMTTYSIEVLEFYNFSFGSMAVIGSAHLWNVYALIDAFEEVEGVMYGDPNYLIGTAGHIAYQPVSGLRYYDFSFQWNDCFDGCDNMRTWKFLVNTDCSVEYLGFEDWGAFGILPLPAPENCNLYNDIIDNPGAQPGFYPNPCRDYLIIEGFFDVTTVELFDTQGAQILKTEVSSSGVLPLTGVLPGLYYIKLTDSIGNKHIGKLIRQ